MRELAIICGLAAVGMFAAYMDERGRRREIETDRNQWRTKFDDVNKRLDKLIKEILNERTK